MTIYFSSLASSSKGNCHFITDGQSYLLIDAGLNGKQLEKRLSALNIEPEKITGIIVSHEHRDHVCGVGIMSRRYDIPIYANRGTWEGMLPIISKVDKKNINVFTSDKPFKIGNFDVFPYSISHDANEPVGFCFDNNGVRISIATDLGCINQVILEKVQGSNLVVLESNHDEEMVKVGKYPYFLKRRILSDLGHLSNEVAGNAVLHLFKSNVKNFILGHLSKENNFPELALQTVKSILEENNIVLGKDIFVEVADDNKTSKLYSFEVLEATS
ncbi:MBL fold metallo-hydrolase [Serpentinicella sp. ANB-PHB4]|uniref:MBL fold metallo-hydrolase n=1 Tax=Serpentinicella sp. ANB-PHB4 TaxID=3074076 RepID=UPI00285870EF|nr:MBL fold metallo-hydrolase [Serpentinicella sp. ANB-PHB4]MDR5658869.1 MBL fold metallo-hydrolase [Serpentinicella sp. ANB-PHB4]